MGKPGLCQRDPAPGTPLPSGPGFHTCAPGLWGAVPFLHTTSAGDPLAQEGRPGGSALKARPGQQQALASGPGGQPGGARSAAPGTGHLPPACRSEPRGGAGGSAGAPVPQEGRVPSPEISRRGTVGGMLPIFQPSPPPLCLVSLPSIPSEAPRLPRFFSSTSIPKCSSLESQRALALKAAGSAGISPPGHH